MNISVVADFYQRFLPEKHSEDALYFFLVGTNCRGDTAHAEGFESGLCAYIRDRLNKAMVAGVPVVATNVGGVAELVESERTGLLVPPADSAALAQAIARYQDDHELRRRVAAQGRERVIQQYNIEIEGQKLLDFFSTLGNLPSV